MTKSPAQAYDFISVGIILHILQRDSNCFQRSNRQTRS